jgi:hypothetical protein
MVYRSNYCAADSEIQTFCEKQSPGVERGFSGFAWIPLDGGPSRREQGTMRLMAPKRSVLIGVPTGISHYPHHCCPYLGEGSVAAIQPAAVDA